MNALLFVILAAATAGAPTKPSTGVATTKAATAAAAPAAPAQAPAPEIAEKAWYEYGVLGWYVRGGRFMIPLFICQVFGLAVIIERWGAYKAISIDTSAFRAKVKETLSTGDVDAAVKLCDDTPGPIAATTAVALRKFKLMTALDKPPDQIQSEVTKSVDDFGVHIIAILERHLPILATVCALGPLFGFLGTVDGMVEAFGEIEAKAGQGDIIKITAGGIYVALYTTVLGLCIGIVTQLAYNMFTNRVNRMVLDVEESATELVQDLTVMNALGAHALKTAGGQNVPARAVPAAT